ARLLSVLLGTGAVLALWLACRLAFSTAWISWAAGLALTLNPEFSFTTATVSNDAGVLFWGVVGPAVWAYGFRVRKAETPTGFRQLLLPVAVIVLVTAAGLLTKLTFLATVPATLIWLFWLVWRPDEESILRRVGRWLAWSLCALGATALIVAPWVTR